MHQFCCLLCVDYYRTWFTLLLCRFSCTCNEGMKEGMNHSAAKHVLVPVSFLQSPLQTWKDMQIFGTILDALSRLGWWEVTLARARQCRILIFEYRTLLYLCPARKFESCRHKGWLAQIEPSSNRLTFPKNSPPI